MTRDDVAGAAAVVRRNHLGDREPFLRFAVEHAACRPFVAEWDGAVVGSGVATSQGRSGWVGMIVVDAAHRRSGLGTALTVAVVEALRAAGRETLLLVATEMGRPIYARLGFEVDGSYVGLAAPGLGDAAAAPGAPDGIRSFDRRDLDAVIRLDREATGEDRAHLLATIARSGEGIVTTDPSGAVSGFSLPSGWGGWPTIAASPRDARLLLERRRILAGAGREVRTAILDANRDGLAMLLSAGWRETWRGVRMRLGPPLEWRPEAIWGQFNFGIG